MRAQTVTRRRVIIDTDAKNEADDQFAIVHALLSPSLDVRGVVAAHFGRRPGRGADGMRESRAEIDLLLGHLGMAGTVRVEDGAEHAMPDARTPMPSAGAALILAEAMREGAGTLFLAFLGPLTDMASALVLEPRIAERDVVVVWIGGPGYDGLDPAPAGPEFNLSNDLVAANVVFRSSLPVWQIPRSTFTQSAVGYAELEEKVAPCGALGRYLVDQLIEWNERHATAPMEYRCLGGSPAIAVLLNPGAGQYRVRPAHGFTWDGGYDDRTAHRPIRVYETIDSRFMFEDLFAKLRRAAAR
ncbi:inosine-uridine nucleoside N-ribohydrolase [Catenuloplanes nepalensis]|uniref:Inosine-uridine nucleoside N-ribohydrolase n=1 Tax=Catenuloplanes nepalensis TaxID=587533 RepID=A0ABT9MVC3_9ACTN|nr:nucleoside hydrolase [Catenuloplanes nepalensis]MDP9794946.1 inosine-uridine nucleoside N-ribohydrolase [Catenuloplanes nepalensis]